jgi:hypothetical protein
VWGPENFRLFGPLHCAIKTFFLTAPPTHPPTNITLSLPLLPLPLLPLRPLCHTHAQAVALNDHLPLPRYGIAQLTMMIQDSLANMVGAAVNTLESVLVDAPTWIDALSMLGKLYPQQPQVCARVKREGVGAALWPCGRGDARRHARIPSCIETPLCTPTPSLTPKTEIQAAPHARSCCCPRAHKHASIPNTPPPA